MKLMIEAKKIEPEFVVCLKNEGSPGGEVLEEVLSR
jgi:hypothetical protein